MGAMTRDEAMRVAASECAKRVRIPDGAVIIDLFPHSPLKEDTAIATAGADAELARVVEWLREHPDFIRDVRQVARDLAARAHWGDDA